MALSLLFTAYQVDGKGKKLKVSVDERIELITTIQLLSDYKWLTQAELDYKRELNASFDAYRQHPAVLYYKSLSRHFYGYDPLLFITHYQLPGFKQIAVFTVEDKAVLKYERYKDSLNEFLLHLKDFHKKSNFNRFFRQNKSYYDSISGEIVKEAARVDYAGIIEKHFGQSNRAYEVLLSPLQMDAGFGPMIQTPEGNILYAIVGPRYDSGTIPEFDKNTLFSELVVHEFSHSFCNPLIDSFYHILKSNSCLLDTIKESQEEQGYGDWKTCLYEHLTRANEIILNEKIYGKAVADSLLKKHAKEDKWIYLPGLVDLLRKYYIDNRSAYPTLIPFMPVVAGYFDAEAILNCKD